MAPKFFGSDIIRLHNRITFKGMKVITLVPLGTCEITSLFIFHSYLGVDRVDGGYIAKLSQGTLQVNPIVSQLLRAYIVTFFTFPLLTYSSHHNCKT